MNKGSGYLTESSSSVTHEKRICDLDTTESSTSRRSNEITITVESIENVDENKVKEVVVLVEFMGNILSQSFQTPIIKTRADMDLTAIINVEDTSPQFLNEILCNPVLFTVLDCTVPGSVSSIPTPNLEAKKKGSKSSASPISLSKSFITNANVLGICNLDIGSIVMGVKRIKETLLVESDKKLTPLEAVSWNKLPKLTVVASTGEEPLTTESIIKFGNILSITVESIYNVPDYIPEGSFFDALIQAPIIGEKAYRIKFPNGVATETEEVSCRKKWVNLSHIDGPGARSKYRIIPDTCDVISGLPEKESIQGDITESPRTIRWDTWRNCLMLKNDVSHFYLKIMKYRVWPIEISLLNKSKEQIPKERSAKSDKKSKPVPSATNTNADHFIAFLNVAPLLYPGETKVRVAAQLMTYSQTDLINKFGAEFPTLQTQASAATVKAKTASERSKASIRDPEEIKDSPGVPVFGDNGYPTFIVVELELSKPLCQKRTPENIEKDLKAYLSLKSKINKKMTNLDMMKNNFSQSIKDVVSTVTSEYQTFCLSNENKEKKAEKESDFYDFLCTRKDFFKIKTTLESKIVDLITEKYGVLDNYAKKLPAVYAYLVNEMHKVTNRYALGYEDVSFPYLNNSELQLYAEEATEEGDYGLAKEYLLLKLSRNTSNPDYWLDVAIHCIGLKKFDKAVEAVREALCLDFYHQIGLLLYALLMMHTFEGSIAEMAFEVLLNKYPDFVEGWMILRLFHVTYGESEGATIAYKQAKIIESEKYLAKKKSEQIESNASRVEFCLDTHKHDKYEPAVEERYGMASFRNGISWSEPLSWTTTICPLNNIRMRTTILLQKLGFCELASMCLSDEIPASALDGTLSPHFVYYSAVNYYLLRRYEEVIPLLQKYAKEYGKDCFIWALLGHCYFKLENHARAISCYEYVLESFNRPDNIHLVYLRMGAYYLQAKKHSCAKQVFRTACKYTSTPRLWKGVGIACLMLEDFEEAEIAFTEANYLDNRDSETWAYLAMTNALLRRLDLFKQCYLEAKKRGLSNMELIQKINALATLNGLTGKVFKM